MAGQGTYGEPEQQKTNPLTQKYYPHEHNEAFLYVHMPSSWELMEVQDDDGKAEWTWLPRVAEQPLMRAVNGIKGDGHDRNPSVFAAEFSRKGGTVIAPTDKRLGEDYMHYVYSVPCRQRDGGIGRYHITKFETLHVLSGRTISKPDDQGYRKFQLHLTTEGIVEPMSEPVLDHKIDGMDARITEQRRRAGENEYLADKMRASISKRDAMRPAWMIQFGTAAQKRAALGGRMKTQAAAEPVKPQSRDLTDDEIEHVSQEMAAGTSRAQIARSLDTNWQTVKRYEAAAQDILDRLAAEAEVNAVDTKPKGPKP